ncbi:N-acetylglucosamine kinase [Streptomyces sp. NPDC050560]|uniref:N-acetylglucosamine kinase n=1 Tax=Streptomyces sp. NPDC050560 TaxID=3365630 RepID=UPI00378D65E6
MNEKTNTQHTGRTGGLDTGATAARPHGRYVVGVDAGGTRTRLRFAAPGGAVLADAAHPAGDWTDLDAEGKARLIAGHLARTADGTPAAIGVGAHGCDSDDECEQLRAALASLVPAPVRVVNDAFLLEAAVPGPEPCGCLVVGTGSIAVARDGAGRSLYAGGWGWLLGDPASGWGTVREAVRLLAAAQDRGGGGDDPLLAPLLRRSGARSLREVAGFMQREPARVWARWAPDVYAAAAAGSPAARAAVDGGATALAGLVGDLVARGARVGRVVAGGSVIAAQPALAAAVSTALRPLGVPRLTVYGGEPVAGAVRLARAALDEG